MLNCLKWITEHMQYNTKSPKLSYCLNFSHHLSGTPLLLEHIAIALSIFWLQILGHHHVKATLKDEPSGLWTPYDSDHSKQSCTKKNVLLVPWELETTQLLRREWEREWAYMKPQRQLITPSTWSDLPFSFENSLCNSIPSPGGSVSGNCPPSKQASNLEEQPTYRAHKAYGCKSTINLTV